MSKLEVHDHCFVSGRRANGGCCGSDGKWQPSRFSHSHEGGDRPHQHPDTGPASYTIDKDEWFRATGLRGGGRKKYTRAASGLQLPWRELEDWQRSFEVIICDRPEAYVGEGPRGAAPMRLVKTFGMTISRVRDERKRRG